MKNGFTLIEMIVALAIVGLLATFVIANVLTSQRRGYDGRRQGDMRGMQNAFEQYFAVNDRYPQDGNEAGGVFPGGNLPTDPRDTPTYRYQVTYDTSVPVGETYCVCALLEEISGNATDATCDYGSGNYFCVSNLQ